MTQHDQGLYHRRWEIETAFREIKCVQKMGEGLRGRTPASIQFEVAGHILLHLLTRWLILEAAIKAGTDPLRLSFKMALDEVKSLIEVLPICSVLTGLKLIAAMRERIARALVPLRPGRHYPRRNDGKSRYPCRRRRRTRPSRLSRRQA